jgi:hypothetical protein
MPMHWSIGLVVTIVVVALASMWWAKNYPGTIPYVT